MVCLDHIEFWPWKGLFLLLISLGDLESPGLINSKVKFKKKNRIGVPAYTLAAHVATNLGYF